jgi:putative sigma-54 modulation protein
MRLVITGRHVTVSDVARQQIERRLRRLDRLLDASAVSAQCVLWQEREAFVCELTIHVRGDHMLHAVHRHGRVTTATAGAVDKVAQQAQRLKDRWKTRRRAGRAASPRPSESGPVPAGRPRVIRSARADLKPMSLEDATLTLADGRQTFLVFRDAGSDAVTILYRRPDGHFGLIEPEA